MGKVLKADGSVDAAYLIGPSLAANDVWYSFGLALTAAALAQWGTFGCNQSAPFAEIVPSDGGEITDDLLLTDPDLFGHFWQDSNGNNGSIPAPIALVWMLCELHYNSLSGFLQFYLNGTSVWSASDLGGDSNISEFSLGVLPGTSIFSSGAIVYFRDVTIGTTRGGTDLFADDFSSDDFSAWSSPVGDVSIIDDPITPPTPPAMNPGRRVGVAFDDGPLEPNPTWTYLDDETVFPSSFVTGYDIRVGRQTLLSQTDTGTATVYINDRAGLLDDRNDDSPYQGKLSGRQIKLQLWNPVTEVWEPQFRGLIDDYRYDIDPATDANGAPINASVQLECVDMFDYLNGFGLTPGLAGQVPPPAGMEDGVYYAPTASFVQDRFFEILTDAKVDPDMYSLAQGNTKVIGVKYDPDESALTACRDAADGELPFIANIYVDRYGRFVFRGRYSRFNPVEVRLGPGDWDFNCWPLGDGVAIRDNLYYNPVADEYQPRGQVRVLSYNRDRSDIINAAMCWPQGLDASDMPGQVYALLGPGESGDLYGKHDAPPMSDLLTGDYVGPGSLSPADDGKTQCYLFAKLLVENKKQPLLSITALQLKSIRPDDHRAAATWGAMCGADISHIVNVAVGYPGGTGLAGDSPQDDYYVEGRSLTVRPLNPEFDYVECNLEVSRAEWSMDTHEVFPPYGS